MTFERVRKLVVVATRGPAVLGTIAVLLLMSHTVLHLSLRALGSPLAGTTEIAAGWYMPAVVFLGLAWAQRSNEHIEARLIFDRVPRPVQLEYQLFTYVAVLALCLVFAWFGLQEARANQAIGLTRGVTGVTVWPAKYLVPVGFAMFGAQLLVDAIRLLKTRQLPEEWDTPAAGPIV